MILYRGTKQYCQYIQYACLEHYFPHAWKTLALFIQYTLLFSVIRQVPGAYCDPTKILPALHLGASPWNSSAERRLFSQIHNKQREKRNILIVRGRRYNHRTIVGVKAYYRYCLRPSSDRSNGFCAASNAFVEAWLINELFPPAGKPHQWMNFTFSLIRRLISTMLLAHCNLYCSAQILEESFENHVVK